MIARLHKQTDPSDLQDQELAALQRSTEAPGLADNLVRPRDDPDAAPSGKRGWRQSRSDAAIQTCLTTKVLFGMALRQTTGFVESLLRLIGLDWRVPDFSTLCRRRKTLAVNIFVSRLEGSAAPLDRQYRYQDGPKRRVWHKTHPGTDEETLEVRAVEVRTPSDQEIGGVTADGVHDTIADRGTAAVNAQVIPPRKTSRPWRPTSAGAVSGNEAVRTSKYLGRALWRRWSGYHRRSRAETRMYCVKLPGQSLKRGALTGRLQSCKFVSSS